MDYYRKSLWDLRIVDQPKTILMMHKHTGTLSARIITEYNLQCQCATPCLYTSTKNLYVYRIWKSNSFWSPGAFAPFAFASVLIKLISNSRYAWVELSWVGTSVSGAKMNKAITSHNSAGRYSWPLKVLFKLFCQREKHARNKHRIVLLRSPETATRRINVINLQRQSTFWNPE